MHKKIDKLHVLLTIRVLRWR